MIPDEAASDAVIELLRSGGERADADRLEALLADWRDDARREDPGTGPRNGAVALTAPIRSDGPDQRAATHTGALSASTDSAAGPVTATRPGGDPSIHHQGGTMTPDEAGVSIDELAEALRNAADGSVQHEAAVELLINGCRGHWLRHDAFRQHVTLDREGDDTDPGPWFADVHWVPLTATLGLGLRDTESEQTVLRVAIELASGWLGSGLASCDRHNSRAIADAVAHAGQVS